MAEPQERRDVLGAARPHHRERRSDGNPGHIGVIARIDLVAGEDGGGVEGGAEIVDEGRAHRQAAFVLALWIARQIFSDVSGMLRSVMP